MLHLKPDNLLIQKTLSEALEAHQKGTPLTLDRVISDFDYTTFHIFNTPEDKAQLYLSVRTKAWISTQECADNGDKNELTQYLKEKYASVLSSSQDTVQFLSQPEQGYDMTVSVHIDQLANNQNTIVQLSLLKTYIMSYPFHLAFNKFNELSKLATTMEEEELLDLIKNKTKLYTIKYRDAENIFIKPSSDRITVIFETIFEDETDKIFGKVFLQEFVDSRKRNRSIQSAPQVLFSHVPPMELHSVYNSSTYDSESSKRFITFVLFPRHFANEELQFKSVSQLVLFRNYFHYHIKCSKAYMHSRMRYRVDSFVKVLNRAKVDDNSDENNNKTSSTSTEQTRRTVTGRKMVY